MIVLKARNANQALPEMMHLLQHHEAVVERPSRNGPVRMFSEPFTIQYQRPLERVVFWRERDANPFFHLFESLWMLGGRDDVRYVAQFSANIAQFSDNGQTFHGAYGKRWRQHFRMDGGQQFIDQLPTIAAALKNNPEDRRQVLAMWDAADDLGGQGKDLPCNLLAVFNRTADGALNMIVNNRSNDIVWGALGANAVHFSVLQEYMAARIGCPVGQYWQQSANMHGYLNTIKNVLPLGDKAFPSQQYKDGDPYEAGVVKPFPLVSTDITKWDSDLRMFLEVGADAMGYTDPFFRRVAIPMLQAYHLFKDKGNPHRFHAAYDKLRGMSDCDWKLAAIEWLQTRDAKAQEKAAADRQTAIAEEHT